MRITVLSLLCAGHGSHLSPMLLCIQHGLMARQSMLLQCRTLWEPTTKHISCRVNGSSFSVSAVMGGFSPMTTCFAATGSEESRRQYM
ncbi:hypothetical protein KCU87_g220, partial [Aureobasidium melanogenum]